MPLIPIIVFKLRMNLQTLNYSTSSIHTLPKYKSSKIQVVGRTTTAFVLLLQK